MPCHYTFEEGHYRRLGHSSSDDPTRYRDEAEVHAWRRRTRSTASALAWCGAALEYRGVNEGAFPL
ncbi:MAG: hypothetical protein JNL08_13530 [Planctomycetes bacterium]|nr:hypothetical protein [Planctomycetota bacterium]